MSVVVGMLVLGAVLGLGVALVEGLQTRRRQQLEDHLDALHLADGRIVCPICDGEGVVWDYGLGGPHSISMDPPTFRRCGACHGAKEVPS